MTPTSKRLILALSVAPLAFAFLLAGTSDEVAAVDLEPRHNFDPECSAAEKELREWREERAKARIAAREAKEVFDRCAAKAADEKVAIARICRVQKRNLGAAVSRRTKATEAFKRAATYHRSVCQSGD